MTENINKTAKKKYQKPELKKVLLKPEEAVLGACKNGAAPGPIQSRCNSPAPCNVIGS
jgi:hypothetical protein